MASLEELRNHSAPYRALEDAELAEKTAKLEWLAAAHDLFPIGCKVLVTHYRGAYAATVARHDASNHSTYVINCKTGKESRAWAGMRSGISPNSTPCLQRWPE